MADPGQTIRSAAPESSLSGFIFKLYGFEYIRELELLQEAGFSSLEVIRAATFCGAEAIMKPKGKPPEFGLIKWNAC